LARRERERAFSAAERDRAIHGLNRDLASWIVVEITTDLAAEAQVLLVRHELRTGDSIQLASCIYLQRETGQRIPFAAFDARLNDAARNEGLTLISFA
jgi:hypothetical protein